MRRPAVVSAPAMFGRLPDQRDYVRWRVGAEEGRIWQDWLNRQTWVGSGRHIVLPGGQTTDEERDGWMHLSPRGEHDMPAPEHHPLPWSFVMSPGFLPMGGTTDWLTGVLMASRDSVGRPWPLVIYQRCGWWMKKIEVRCCEKVRCRGSVYVCLCRNVPARICLGRNRCKH